MDREKLNKMFGVTEEQLDAWAEEYESGTWDAASLGEVKRGRPSLADEDVKPVTFRLPESWIVAMDRRAEEEGITRSEFLRSAVETALVDRG